MEQVADTGGIPETTDLDLSRLLHPSAGLPHRLAMALAGSGWDDAVERQVAEVTRIEEIPAFLAGRED